MVDLPQPLGPTKATDLPTGMVKETSLRIGNIEMRGILEGNVGEGDVAVVTLLLDRSRRIVLAGEVDDADYVLGGTLHQYDRRRIDNTDANELSTHENTHHNCEDVRKLSFSPFNEYRS